MMPEIPFRLPPGKLEPAAGEIHVFCASLEVSLTRRERFREILSGEERARAARFVFERDQHRFLAGRGLLREILGWLLQADPGQLDFAYNPCGKPSLAAPVYGRFLHFNVAHSGSLGVYAVSLDREVGIDLEQIRVVREAEQIVAGLFSGREAIEWRSLPADRQTEAFFHSWTCKEACLKAMGRGLSAPLNAIEIPLFSGDPAELLLFEGDLQSATRWLLYPLNLTSDYIGAVAVQNKVAAASIHRWRWHER